MAVPKKRVSRSKKKSRFAGWLQKSNASAKRAVSLGKSLNSKPRKKLSSMFGKGLLLR